MFVHTSKGALEFRVMFGPGQSGFSVPDEST
jgi:hypothetical protein